MGRSELRTVGMASHVRTINDGMIRILEVRVGYRFPWKSVSVVRNSAAACGGGDRLSLSAYSSSRGNGSVARSNERNHLPIERSSISIASIEPSHRFLDHRIHGCPSRRSCYRPQLRGISIARQGAFERLNCGGRAFPVGMSNASGGEI